MRLSGAPVKGYNRGLIRAIGAFAPRLFGLAGPQMQDLEVRWVFEQALRKSPVVLF